jgi:hypothetical protein
MEERMTVCNMSIEAGARAGLIAPAEVPYAYLAGRPRAPQAEAWERALAAWRTLPSDPGARFDREVTIDAAGVEPMITYGTNPGMVMPIGGQIPVRPDDVAFARALSYMGLTPGQPLKDQKVNVVFLGSCTNARLSDLREAARLLRGRRIARGLTMLVVPGSQEVKRQAESEGLHRVFLEAGAEWRESGCSMCLGMNGDVVARGEYSVSTSNRNFEGRQGAGARTLLASPLTAAACALTGRVTDPRRCSPGAATLHDYLRTVAAGGDTTRQIIPARFLTTDAGAWGAAVRRLALRAERCAARFVLNCRAAGCRLPGATSAVPSRGTRRGHSHEHGFRAVISTEIADIFRSNALEERPVGDRRGPVSLAARAPEGEPRVATRPHAAPGRDDEFPLEAFAQHCRRRAWCPRHRSRRAAIEPSAPRMSADREPAR